MTNAYVQRFGPNQIGHDYCVGDIHGHFSRLAVQLEAIGFDGRFDRLFSVGDLVDRGPESHRVLEWLANPWFHPVQGNHEDMAIRYVNPGKRDREHYMMNGGAWLIGSTEAEQGAYADALATLPYAIEVETADGLIGIVHADCTYGTWGEMIDAFAAASSKNQLRKITDNCLWSRDRIQYEMHGGVSGVRAVVVGHTPIKRPAVLGNVYHIDTGGWLKDGHFTFLRLDTLETIPPMARKLEWPGA